MTWVLLVALISMDGAPAPETALKVKRVLYIGIDGCRPDALLAADAPALKGLIASGAFSDCAQTGANTVSGPGWSSALCGVWSEKHGVRDNKFRGANFGKYPHFFRRLKQSRPSSFAASVAHWAPINLLIVRDADFTRTRNKDSEVAADAFTVLREKDPDVLFVHFDDVDHAGHATGFSLSNPDYLKAIAAVDREVGRLLETMKRRPRFNVEDWLVLVTTDHGGSGTKHGEDIPEHRTIFVIVSGPAALRGKIAPPPRIVDVPATALAHLGIRTDPSWDWDGRPVGLAAPLAMKGTVTPVALDWQRAKSVD